MIFMHLAMLFELSIRHIHTPLTH